MTAEAAKSEAVAMKWIHMKEFREDSGGNQFPADPRMCPPTNVTLMPGNNYEVLEWIADDMIRGGFAEVWTPPNSRTRAPAKVEAATVDAAPEKRRPGRPRKNA